MWKGTLSFPRKWIRRVSSDFHHRSHALASPRGVDAPLPGVRHVADGVVEPHVEPFARRLGIVEGNGHAPVRVAGDASRAEVADPAIGDALHVGPPFRMRVEPLLERLREILQAEKPVGRVLQNRRRIVAGDIRFRVDQIVGRILGPTVLAFVPCGFLEPAFWARALDVAVGQESSRLLRVPQFHILLVDVAAFVQIGEERLGGLGMQRPGGTPVEVKRNAEARKSRVVRGVIPVDHLRRADAFLQRRQCNRHAVLIRAADVKHRLAPESQVADVHVRGQIRPRDVAQMNVAVGIGQGPRDQCPCELSLVSHGTPLALVLS